MPPTGARRLWQKRDIAIEINALVALAVMNPILRAASVASDTALTGSG